MTIAASVTKFQSTHPRGVRPVEFDDMIHRVIFQSTHPRGVRHSSYVSHQKFESISIHAPARGATPGLSVDHVGHQISIHAPARGATYRSTVTEETPTISIHAPARGATAVRVVLHASVVISIHAPARGATFTHSNYTIFYSHFNPRTREGCD